MRLIGTLRRLFRNERYKRDQLVTSGVFTACHHPVYRGVDRAHFAWVDIAQILGADDHAPVRILCFQAAYPSSWSVTNASDCRRSQCRDPSRFRGSA